MAYSFTNKPFPWTNVGSLPSAAEIALGYQGYMCVDAGHLNAQWNRTYLAVKEIQDKVEDGTILTQTAVGGDFAECYEWECNDTTEDRTGLFVTLNGEKIKLANAGDYILGAISDTACLVGDAYLPDGSCKLENPDFAVVGICGKLIVHDDGTCVPNGYCTAGKDGIATASESGYRVLSRIDENRIKINFK